MSNFILQSTALRQIEALHNEQPLMQRAGNAAASRAIKLIHDQRLPILVLVGPGNNGGDAFEVARLLRDAQYYVKVIFRETPEHLPIDAAKAHRRFLLSGGKTLTEIPRVDRWGLIIDGLFGIGLKRPIEGHYAESIETANMLALRDDCPVLALDCPSGLNCDTGDLPGPCIKASHTITFIANKPGLLNANGPDYCGQVEIADLGITYWPDNVESGKIVDLDDFLERLLPRPLNSHKGSFGSIGILGGSPGMLGAPLLSGRAALKLGSGRVYLGLLDPSAPAVDPAQPELMLRSARELLAFPDLHTLVCGPGLGKSTEARQVLHEAIQRRLPLLLDADALNLLACDRELKAQITNREHPVILTPHPTEAARLLDCTTEEIQRDRIAAAKKICQDYRAHVVLKGCGSVIALQEGGWWINTTGNPGMATAGTGDILCGQIASLLGQGWPAAQALLAGVHIHGAAADLLVTQGKGPIGLTASELIDAARTLFNQWVALANRL